MIVTSGAMTALCHILGHAWMTHWLADRLVCRRCGVVGQEEPGK